MTVVLVHNEFGIYLGNCMGLGFFSMLDCAGQDQAVTFATPEAARQHVADWTSENDPLRFHTVQVIAASTWATIDELDAAGLEHLTGPMKSERLRNMPTAGRA
jgi:hypothetical protein